LVQLPVPHSLHDSSDVIVITKSKGDTKTLKGLLAESKQLAPRLESGSLQVHSVEEIIEQVQEREAETITRKAN